MVDSSTVAVVALVAQIIVLRMMDRWCRVFGAYTSVVGAYARAVIRAHKNEREHRIVKQQLVKAVEYFADELSRKENAA